MKEIIRVILDLEKAREIYEKRLHKVAEGIATTATTNFGTDEEKQKLIDAYGKLSERYEKLIDIINEKQKRYEDDLICWSGR